MISQSFSAKNIVLLVVLILLAACAPEAAQPTATPVAPSVTGAPSTDADAPSTTIQQTPITAMPIAGAVVTALPEPPATPDPAARVVPMVVRKELPPELAQQLAYIPPQAGGIDACIDANASADQKLFVASPSVRLGQAATICYQGLAKGKASEQIIGPDGKPLRTYRFPSDNDLFTSSFVVFPDDRPGRYTVETQTPAGVLKTTFEVTNQIYTRETPAPFMERLYRDRFEDWRWDAPIADLQYLLVGNFSPSAAIDVGFYEGCRLPGWRRFGYYGRNLLASAQARVNAEGYAFLTVSEEISRAVGQPKLLSIVVQAGGIPQNVGLLITDPLRFKRERARELADSANSNPPSPPSSAAVADGYGPVDLEEGTELPPCPAAASAPALPEGLPQAEQRWRAEITEFSAAQAQHFAINGTRVSIAAFGGNAPISIDGTSGSKVAGEQPPADLAKITVADGAIYTASETTIRAADSAGTTTWSTQLDQPARTAPLIAGGVVYIGDASGHIVALDKSSGARRGDFKAPAGWESVMFDSGSGTGANWAPALTAADGMLFLGGEDGVLYALDGATGATRWQRQIPIGTSSAPEVAGDTVYVGGYDGYLYALDTNSGRIQWQFAAGDWVGQPHVVGQSVIATSENNRVFALDTSTGRPQWSYDAKENILWSGVTAAESIVLATATQNSKLILIGLRPGTGASSTAVEPASSARIPADQIRVSASGQSPSGKDGCQKPTTFDPAQAIDGDTSTAWRVPGDGKDAYIQLEFDTAIAIAEVQLIPGYAKVDTCSGDNRFTQNRRIKRVRLSFADGSSVEGTFHDEAVFQAIQFKPIETKWVRVTILDTFPQPPGDVGRDFTPMSEITVLRKLP